MILKGAKSLALPKYYGSNRELQFNHIRRLTDTDFEVRELRCPHTIVKEIPDPESNVMKIICTACGKEVA